MDQELDNYADSNDRRPGSPFGVLAPVGVTAFLAALVFLPFLALLTSAALALED